MDEASRAAEVAVGQVVLVGQHKALAIAVKGPQTRRRWSKLREWLDNTHPVNPRAQPMIATGW